MAETPGIIPARAGFTDERAPQASQGADHPRSRGVYASRPPPHPLRGGSSPLARGLHRRRLASGDHRRIIPARAGFTRPRGRRGATRSDHPRSRGVYATDPTHLAPRCGSSPLARGLRPTECSSPRRQGIIPARAGFTMTLPQSPYVVPGSSPLARGLRSRKGRVEDNSGIIPARAGFTQSRADVCVKGRDHPRSRGVYVSAVLGPLRARGSSPLARGLHNLSVDGNDAVRIIPARAGFTAGHG